MIMIALDIVIGVWVICKIIEIIDIIKSNKDKKGVE